MLRWPFQCEIPPPSDTGPPIAWLLLIVDKFNDRLPEFNIPPPEWFVGALPPVRVIPVIETVEPA